MSDNLSADAPRDADEGEDDKHKHGRRTLEREGWPDEIAFDESPYNRFPIERHGEFLHALATLGTVRAAAKAVDAPRSTLYWRRKEDKGFARAWAEVEDLILAMRSNDLCEQMFEDAIEGRPYERYHPNGEIAEKGSRPSRHGPQLLAQTQPKRFNKQVGYSKTHDGDQDSAERDRAARLLATVQLMRADRAPLPPEEQRSEPAAEAVEATNTEAGADA